jgi:hypothetical protein
MNEITANVIANVIAWPIIIGLGVVATKTWRVIKKVDGLEREKIQSNVAYRTAASAQGVSDIVIGCSAILFGVIWILFLLVFGMMDIQAGYWQINHEVQQIFAKSLLTSSAGKPIELPPIPTLHVIRVSFGLYLGYCFIGLGFINVLSGKRLLSHLARAALK